MSIVRSLIKPALISGLGIILYLIATNTGAGWLYVISAGIAAVIGISAFAAFMNTRGLEVMRRAAPAGVAHEPLLCELTIRNTSRLPRYMLEIEDRLAGGSGRVLVVAAGRRGGPDTKTSYTVESPKRGIYPGGEIEIGSGAPFGLFSGRSRVDAESEVVVYPRTFEVAGLPPAIPDEGERTEHEEASVPRRDQGGELWGVRDYRPGDPARMVAWRVSARSLSSGRLAVMELARETPPPFILAMNLNPRAPEPAREMVVSAGASLLLRALREGRQVFADAGTQSMDFPEDPDAESVLTWCAGLISVTPPRLEDASVVVQPSLRGAGTPDSGTIALVSCWQFDGPGNWMTPDEEQEYVRKVEAGGGRAMVFGPDVEEPWRI